MRYDAILFDLDGTLTASAPGVCASARYALAETGCPVPPDDVLQRFLGPPLVYSYPEYAGVPLEDVDRVVAIHRAHYHEHGVLDAVVYPGIPNLLRRLRAAGVYLAIASAKPEPLVHRVLEHFGLARFFDCIVGNTFERRESDKTVLLRAALPLKWQRAAMVGDRKFDMEAAVALGIDGIGALWGYGTQEELMQSGAVGCAATADAMAALLLEGDVPPPPGFFITIEGIDGSGKTTQMNAVAAHLAARGYEVVRTREPGGSPVAETIRQLILSPDNPIHAHTEVLLFAAARAEHVRELVRPALSRGAVVLCDRFVDSSVAYQGAGRELGMDRVAAINAFAIGGTMPDLTLLFVLDTRTAFLHRKAATPLDRMERSGEAFFQRVCDGYAQIARAESRVRCIDARLTIDQVTQEACRQIDLLLAAR
ncbi:MAG: dTMP kinase [Oscillospiraceae bacterium]|nr:dTMP kinase [Oscillospiraceae bacterium]